MRIEMAAVKQELTKDLFRAAKNGDWKSARNMIEKLTNKITDKQETVLHIAAAYNQHNFVRELLNFSIGNLSKEALTSFLETQNSSGNTALCYAALTGDVEIASLMVQTHGSVREESSTIGLPDLGTIKPVLFATWHQHKKMVEYLLDKTLTLTTKESHEVFLGIVRMGLYDKALKMLEKKENAYLAAAGSDGDIALHVLASTPSAFVQKDQPLRRKCINFGTKASETSIAEPRGVIRLVNKLVEIAESRGEDFEANINPEMVIAETLVIAAQEGNTELVIHLLRDHPDLVWKAHPENGSIFHIAVEKRHESIFTLIHEFGAMDRDLIAKMKVGRGNNMLHLAAQLPPQSKLNQVSGAALQMQRELCWFKEVEKIVQPSLKHKENKEGKTPQVLFKESHANLIHAGEKWLKDAARSCMLVSTLISTIAFMSVPGGYNDKGDPSRKNNTGFLIFSLSNTTSWFSAATSTVMFAFVLTSRYAEEDFLYSLPSKLTLGVASLLVSIGSMMVAFCATFLLYCDFGWLVASLIVFPFLPLAYVSVKYPLLFDVIFSAHRSRRMFQWPIRLA